MILREFFAVYWVYSFPIVVNTSISAQIMSLIVHPYIAVVIDSL
jgi:hypothetical protein